MRLTSTKQIPFIYPFLIALYPVLFLYTHNIDRVPFMETTRTIAAVLFVTLLLFSLIWILFHSAHRAALFSAFAAVLFSAYGNVYNALMGKQFLGIPLGYANVLAAIWAAVFILIGWAILRLVRKPEELTSSLNIFSVILICIPLFQIGIYVTRLHPVKAEAVKPDSESSGLDVLIQSGERHPDVYYIILDGYDRADVLNDIMGFDNSAFLGFLRERGFYVANDSHANYPYSHLSIASSLNYKYISSEEDHWSQATDIISFVDQIHENRVLSRFKQYGYRSVTFATGFFPTEIKDSDLYIVPKNYLNQFEVQYLSGTVVVLSPATIYADRSRALIQTPLSALPGIAASDPAIPKFVFIHIPATHVPFVFGPNGEKTSMWTFVPDDPFGRTYQQVYVDQLQYINSMVSEAVDGILANSPVSPIIILQSDHGSEERMNWVSVDKTCLVERMGILNAYYLPEDLQAKLYPSITPVNTFRLIFDELFNTSFGLLEDFVYFTTLDKSDYFIDVTERANTCSGWE